MADSMRGKYHKKMFRREFEAAQQRLRPLGGQVEPGRFDYEAFTYIVPGLTLIFYPHRVSTTGNRHIRVRSAPGADPKLLEKAIFALAENSCTFQYPMDRDLHNRAVSASVQREYASRTALPQKKKPSGTTP